MSADPSPQPPSNLKLLLIGNSSVGKSSLLLRFTDDDFLSEEETAATIGVDFKVKSVEVDGRRYKLSIWDTAGQERFRTLTSSYYRGAQGVILVYDVTQRNTFDELIKWFREIDTYCAEDVVKIIVGNKVDKVTLVAIRRADESQEFTRQVTTEEGQAFADRMGTLFMECSAKTRVGVNDAFQVLVRRILETPSLWTRGPQPVRTPNVQLQEDAPGYLSGCSC
ncbi:putative Ras-related protein Rab-18 [Trichosporon asahii var. asahii CBS 2479]|uniref:Putative Ras-related protein Rab-18 n=1 Tax=Trichosporon asahii var. asahii (strain ATCC 90039 / CBS 2479 / JCM 2466 / KCTC 7840 / NBRC 103889/ NCYC 2677 / UAMH 7654) TaxID=1186058 RepID=J6F3S1_TRIAS|nr:putative Ras-related protein Rab-18 [Trichosporon asahii var. asahii CBS 2479]EJT49887.1 putative Ras-related protein Rab-18 [Trichosporon asahii var. asahii CBS 2479]